MALESATYISQLVATNPPGSDPLAQADDHLRLIKGVLQAQFPNLGAAAVTPTATELNYVDGVTSAIQTQMDLKSPLASPTFTGTPAAPTAAAATNTTQIATTAHVFAERTNAATLTNKTLTAPVINSPTGIVKADVGLPNVDNTSDASKPVSTATQAALDLKANLASPALTGTPTAPTATVGTNTTQIATMAALQAAALAATLPGESGATAGKALISGGSPGSAGWTVTPVPAGLATASGLTMSTGKLLGRTTAGTGAIEELAITDFARVATANTFSLAQDFATGSNIASASTVNLNTATGNRVHITGTTTITAVTLTRGPRTVIFDGILTLTHHATNNNLPGAANITTAAGDRAIYESDGTTVYCVDYIKVDGTAVVGGGSPTFGALGTAAVLQATAATGDGCPAIAMLSATQAVAVWRTSSSDLRACTLNISGATVTAGAILTAVGSGVQVDPIAIARLSSTVAVVAYTNGSSLSAALCLSVSGTTLTAGSATTVSSARNVSGTKLVPLSATTMLITGASSNSAIISVSGTTISVGTEVATHGATSAFISAALMESGYVGIYYSVSNVLKFVLVAYSGTTITAPTASTDVLTVGSTGNSAGGATCTIAGNRQFIYGSWVSAPGLASNVSRLSGSSSPLNGPNIPVSIVSSGLGLQTSPLVSGNGVLVLDRQESGGSFSVQAFDVRDAMPKPLCGKSVTRRNTSVSVFGDLCVLSATQALICYADPNNSSYPTACVLDLGTLSAL